MTAYEICLLALLLGGMVPALVICSRGDPIDRMVGLDLLAAVITFVLILFYKVGPGESYDLILPLVLVPLSFAGTLVFARLLVRERQDQE